MLGAPQTVALSAEETFVKLTDSLKKVGKHAKADGSLTKIYSDPEVLVSPTTVIYYATYNYISAERKDGSLIETLLISGDFNNQSEVIRAGIRLLIARQLS